MPRVSVIVAAFVAFAIAAALGISAVYVKTGREGNVPAPEAGPARGAGVSGSASDAAKLAAFVIHETPKPVAEIDFQTEDGEPVSLAAWRGRTVLVNLWATWCAPCRHEMPALDRLQQRLGGDGFEVVAISLDRGGPDKARAFYEEIGVEHLALYSDPTSKIGAALGVIGMPTTLLIDAEGREIGRLAGAAEWDSEQAVAMIARTIGNGG